MKLESNLDALQRQLRSPSSAVLLEPKAVEAVHLVISFHVANQRAFEAAIGPPGHLVPDLDGLQDSIEEMLERGSSSSSGLLATQVSRRLVDLAAEYAARLLAVRDRVSGVDFRYLERVIEAVEGINLGPSSASREASGIAAAVALHRVYQERGDGELRSANTFRISAVAVLAASACALALLALRSNDITVATSLQKLALTIPGVTLFGYFANQSRVHRLRSDTLLDVAVRLETVDAYCERLEPPLGSEILSHFGRSLFVIPTSVGGDSSTEQTNVQALDSALAIVERLQQLQGRSGPAPT